MNADYLQKQFAGLGLTAFTEHMEKLARIWLQGEPGEAFYQQLFDYMQGCGIYGKDENGIWNRFCDAQPEKGEKGRDALKRWYWFPPYEYMVLYYPWLSRNPVAGKFLLPAAWGIRAVRGCGLRPGKIQAGNAAADRCITDRCKTGYLPQTAVTFSLVCSIEIFIRSVRKP